MIILFPCLLYEVGFQTQVADQKQMLMIVDSNGLNIKSGMKIPSSLEHTLGQWRVESWP